MAGVSGALVGLATAEQFVAHGVVVLQVSAQRLTTKLGFTSLVLHGHVFFRSDAVLAVGVGVALEDDVFHGDTESFGDQTTAAQTADDSVLESATDEDQLTQAEDGERKFLRVPALHRQVAEGEEVKLRRLVIPGRRREAGSSGPNPRTW